MRSAYVKAIILGAVAGMRMMSAPALVSTSLARRKSDAAAHPSFALFADARMAAAFRIGAACEIAADKLPVLPDRISPPSLAGRAISGAICGAAIARSQRKPAAGGAAIGTAAAMASAFAFFYIRRELGRRTNVPDAVFALAEDALAIAAGITALREDS